jgi:hypothetical protein
LPPPRRSVPSLARGRFLRPCRPVKAGKPEQKASATAVRGGFFYGVRGNTMTDDQLNARFDKLEEMLTSLVEEVEREAEPSRTKTAVRVFDPEGVYTINEVAKRGGLSRSSLYQEMNAGNLPFVQHKSCRRFIGADLNRFLSRRYHSVKTEE